jgi:hypothetical protein
MICLSSMDIDKNKVFAISLGLDYINKHDKKAEM